MNKRYLTAALSLVVACTFGVLVITTNSFQGSQRLLRIVFREGNNSIHQSVDDRTAVGTATADSQQLIPKILHHVYLDGLDNLKQAESAAKAKPGQRFPGYNSTWRHSCYSMHQNWQYMFWNMSTAENLLQTYYPWFLATFRSYNSNVQKGDSLRPFLMHAIGGLYLDIDVECFVPTDQLLSGRDVVLQLEDSNPKSLNNAVMASVPGHPFWLNVIQVMMDRNGTASRGFLGFKDLGVILKTTGPYTMRDAFKAFTDEAGELQEGWAGHWMVKNTRFHVYPMGQWFEPCKWDDYKCHAQIQATDKLPPDLVGHHINSGAWLKELRWHNRKLAAVWVLAGGLCLSIVGFYWKRRRRA